MDNSQDDSKWDELSDDEESDDEAPDFPILFHVGLPLFRQRLSKWSLKVAPKKPEQQPDAKPTAQPKPKLQNTVHHVCTAQSLITDS